MHSALYTMHTHYALHGPLTPYMVLTGRGSPPQTIKLLAFNVPFTHYVHPLHVMLCAPLTHYMHPLCATLCAPITCYIHPLDTTCTHYTYPLCAICTPCTPRAP